MNIPGKQLINPLTTSIRNKLLVAFSFMLLLMVALGVVSAKGLSDQFATTLQLYDKPLQSINFSRGALIGFLEIDKGLTELLLSDNRVNIDEDLEILEEMEEQLLDDLDIVGERMDSDDVHRKIALVSLGLSKLAKIRETISESGLENIDKVKLIEIKQEIAADVRDKLNDISDTAVENGFIFIEEAKAKNKTVMNIQYIELALSLIAGLASAIFLAKHIAEPLCILTKRMIELSNGEQNVEVPYLNRLDEIGHMSKAFQHFKVAAVEKQRLEKEQRETEKTIHQQKVEAAIKEQKSEEDRRRQLAENDKKNLIERKEFMANLANKFEESMLHIVENLSVASAALEESAQTMSVTADETKLKSTSVLSTSEQAAGNAQLVAKSASELSISLDKISAEVYKSSEYSDCAVHETTRANIEIQGLVDAADKIGDVVNLINEIAKQTNLLALNATIEAARAGDSGKGFAVVATEVKNLAAQTATATEGIESQVQDMQLATEKAVNAIESIEAVISKINQNNSEISNSVRIQETATSEIADNVSEISQGTLDINYNINDMNDGAGKTGRSANEVFNSSQALSKQSNYLKDQLVEFLSQIRNV